MNHLQMMLSHADLLGRWDAFCCFVPAQEPSRCLAASCISPADGFLLHFRPKVQRHLRARWHASGGLVMAICRDCVAQIGWG